MTTEEAIGKIRRLKKECRAIAFQWDWYEDCLDMAIEALEKQTKKKPEPYYDGYADGYPAWEYSCPNCGRDVDDTDHHCICGQTLDWSEEE